MKTLKLISMLSGLMLLAGCLPYSTGPTEVGVRTVKWSPFGKGVQEKVYEPGSTHFFPIFFTDWYTFDTRLQNFEMTALAREGGDRQGRDDVRFKTIDGNDISLDVIISYKIDPAKAPYILTHVATSDEELKENIVRTVARSKPRDIFGELNTEEFYIAENRTKKSEEVLKQLNEILAPYGVIVERVGTRDYSFNADYQKAILDKKIADQQAEKLKAETRAIEEENRTNVAKAEADIEKIKAQADGEYKRAMIEADAYFDQQEKVAQAIEAEGRAEAEGIKKMNEALSGPGGYAMVKMKIAESLMDKRIIMLPMGTGLDLRTTDVNGLLQLYGLKDLSAPKTESKAAEAKGAARQ